MWRAAPSEPGRNQLESPHQWVAVAVCCIWKSFTAAFLIVAGGTSTSTGTGTGTGSGARTALSTGLPMRSERCKALSSAGSIWSGLAGGLGCFSGGRGSLHLQLFLLSYTRMRDAALLVVVVENFLM